MEDERCEIPQNCVVKDQNDDSKRAHDSCVAYKVDDTGQYSLTQHTMAMFPH
jgi:hypothetical protein